MEGDGRRAVLLLKSVQTLIAKYGSAAHLAILAVAPLFLFPFFTASVSATVLVWLALPAWLWLVLEPSLREGEAPHDARERVVRSIVRDPLSWLMVVLILGTGFRALNAGIGLAYDAEAAKWHVSSAFLPVYPGVVGTSGYLPFAAAVALAVVLQGARHALGKSAVAEGVENEEQLSILRELGCDMVQGYYYSKPLPEDEFEKYMEKYQKED